MQGGREEAGSSKRGWKVFGDKLERIEPHERRELRSNISSFSVLLLLLLFLLLLLLLLLLLFLFLSPNHIGKLK